MTAVGHDPLRWRFWCPGVRLVVGMAAMLLAAPNQVASEVVATEAVDEAFQSLVGPLVRQFIEANYEEYGEGQVTFRHLKRHLAKSASIGMTYEELSEDRYSAVIEDEIDAIVARCDSGRLPVACVQDISASQHHAGEL
mmetsp:Transcript_43033/g.119011  ORF Transcript_43033/g.119011 Transcript_43033/m.119011 type:complete len:139 (-) Transcript_43033:162-578(-)